VESRLAFLPEADRRRVEETARLMIREFSGQVFGRIYESLEGRRGAGA
jgi:hypothetical protein